MTQPYAVDTVAGASSAAAAMAKPTIWPVMPMKSRRRRGNELTIQSATMLIPKLVIPEDVSQTAETCWRKREERTHGQGGGGGVALPCNLEHLGAVVHDRVDAVQRAQHSQADAGQKRAVVARAEHCGQGGREGRRDGADR